MANTIISPNRYVQGRGELKNLPEHAKKLGKKLFVIISASGLKRVRDLLEKSFENTGMELVFEEFQGECCETEIKRLGSRFQENKCDLVVGVGGGKIHDSAKAAAYYQGQLDAYAKALAEICQKPVQEKLLYFVATEEAVPV